MKKFFYTLLFIAAVSILASSCTKEEVKPQAESFGGGTSGKI